MKKLLSVLFVVCLLATTVTLASCGHECEFSTEWSKDATAHWHACTGEKCEEIADKADHTWDDGKITTKATQEADGVKTFTCTVCAQTKTETVKFTGLSEEDWNAAFDDSVFSNFAYSEVSSTTGTGVAMDTETVYKFDGETAWAKVTMMGQTQESFAPDKESAEMIRDQLIASIKSLAPYASYEYDAETKTYKAKEAIEVASLGASTSDITLTFADGRLVSVKYTITFSQSGIEFTADSTVTISDYGTVELNPEA